MQTSSSVPTRIATLKRLIAAHHSARVGGPREAIGKVLGDEVAMAISDSLALYQKLSNQTTWLDASPNHPQHEEREATYLANLDDYEALETAIGEVNAKRGVDCERSRSWKTQGDAFDQWRQAWRAAMGYA
jgi:hypothetical protein